MTANTQRLIDTVRANRNNENYTNGSEIIFTYLEAFTDNSRDVSLDYKLSGGLSNLPNPSSPAKFLPGISPIPGKDIALPKTSCSGEFVCLEMNVHIIRCSSKKKRISHVAASMQNDILYELCLNQYFKVPT